MKTKIPYSKRPAPVLKVNGTRDQLYNEHRRDKWAARFYRSVAWLKLREIKLCNSPYCEDHLEIGEYVVAVIVHHVKELRDYPELALDLENLRSQCRGCHNTEHKSKPSTHQHPRMGGHLLASIHP